MQIFDSTVSPAVAEARLLHPQDSGYFTVASRRPSGAWGESHFHMSKLDAVSETLRGRSDTYISQASFASKVRRSFNTKSLRCAFVDLDTYNVDVGADISTQVHRIEQRARELGVPQPSYIASSGRGLYAKWVFDDPINASLMPQWKLMQQKLMSAYLHMGADSKVVDAARVLRVQESINSKSGSEVVLLKQGQTHSFADLFRSTEPLEIFKKAKDGTIKKTAGTVIHGGQRLGAEDLASDAALTDLDGLVRYSEQHTPVMMKAISRQGLNWSRFLDLRDLVIRRGGIHKGSRDIVLFWMVNFLAQAEQIDPSNFWGEVRSLLSSFPVGRDFNPLQDGSLATLHDRITRQHRGEKIILDGIAYDPVYTPRNDTLINILQISADEEMEMRTIISTDEKRRRADLKAPGRAERRCQRQEMRAVATSMCEQGVGVNEIARRLGKNKSTISRWLTPAEGAGQPFLETRGRRKANHGAANIRITGRGAFNADTGERITFGPDGKPITPPNQTPGCGLHKGDPRRFSPDEIRRRTRIRPQKAHLAHNRVVWSPSQINAWLKEKLDRAAEAVTELGLRDERSEKTQQAQDCAELSLALLERIRLATRSATAAQISLWRAGSLSSNPTTGPPDAPAASP